MAAYIGHIVVELLARVGDGEPQSMGVIQIPLTVKSVSTATIEASLKEAIDYVSEDLKAVFGTDRASTRAKAAE
jgi:hypothetical protein